MTPEEALERINILRSCVVKTQESTWSNTLYPLIAILNSAGFEAIEPTPEQIEAHRRAYPIFLTPNGYPSISKRD